MYLAVREDADRPPYTYIAEEEAIAQQITAPATSTYNLTRSLNIRTYLYSTYTTTWQGKWEEVQTKESDKGRVKRQCVHSGMQVAGYSDTVIPNAEVDTGLCALLLLLLLILLLLLLLPLLLMLLCANGYAPLPWPKKEADEKTYRLRPSSNNAANAIYCLLLTIRENQHKLCWPSNFVLCILQQET